MWRAPPHTCLMGSARNSLFCATDLTLKMTSDKKNGQHESCSSRRNGQDCFWTHFHPRSFTTTKKTRKVQPVLDRTVLESSDKTNPNLTRVLDVNPNLFLAREVQPPLIYLRGDSRLNNTQSIKSSTTFYLLSFLLNPSSSSSSFFVCSSCCRAANLEALGAIRST